MLARIMRNYFPLVLTSLLLFSACGDKAANAANAGNAANAAAAAAGDAAKQIAAVDKLKAPVADAIKLLGTITDGASAEKAKAGLEGVVGSLKTHLSELGGLGKLGDAAMKAKDGLLKPVMDKVTGLLGNADITKAIGPVLEQLKGLLGGK